MIQMQSVLNVSDNSGAKKVVCIKVLGGSKKMLGYCGDVIVTSILSSVSCGTVKRGTIHNAVIIRTKYGVTNYDGNCVKFYDNAVVLLDKNFDCIGTRVFGVVPLILKKYGFSKVIALAEEVI